LGWLLLGFVISQTYKYYLHPAKDRRTFRVLIYCSVFLVAIESVTEGLTAVWFLVTEWGSLSLFAADTPFTFVANLVSNLQPLFDAFSGVFVQAFFTWRIWTFCMAVYGRRGKLIIAGICLFLALASLCSFISCLLSVIVSAVNPNHSIKSATSSILVCCS